MKSRIKRMKKKKKKRKQKRLKKKKKQKIKKIKIDLIINLFSIAFHRWINLYLKIFP